MRRWSFIETGLLPTDTGGAGLHADTASEANANAKIRIAIAFILTNFAKVAKLHSVGTYPQQILDIVSNACHASEVASSNAVGRDVNFACACFVQLTAYIDIAGKGRIENVSFRSNGCGYMVAAAEILASYIEGHVLSELHGLDRTELLEHIEKHLGAPDGRRTECIETVLNALKNLFAGHRIKRIQEFTGEKALVCTCFGISEEAIDNIVATRSGITVDGIGAEFRAGLGCGSCRMLIQELIDASASAP